MAGYLVAERTLKVGTELVVEGPSPSSAYMTVFEDDGDTGYLYGLDTEKMGNPIVDALHVYNVQAVTDRDRPSVVKIVWSNDGLKSALLINDYPHAVFDFESRRAYCRTGFPQASGTWATGGHDWDDAVLELFRS